MTYILSICSGLGFASGLGAGRIILVARVIVCAIVDAEVDPARVINKETMHMY